MAALLPSFVASAARHFMPEGTLKCATTKSAAAAFYAVVRSPLQRHSMPSYEVRKHDGLRHCGMLRSPTAWNAVLRSPTAASQRYRVTKSAAAAFYAVVRSPLQRHRMPLYEVRSSGIGCRRTKSAAAAASLPCYEVPRQRSCRGHAAAEQSSASSIVPRSWHKGVLLQKSSSIFTKKNYANLS